MQWCILYVDAHMSTCTHTYMCSENNAWGHKYIRTLHSTCSDNLMLDSMGKNWKLKADSALASDKGK